MLEAIKESPVKFGVAIFVIVLLNVVGWFAYFTWQNPLGAPLELPTATTEPLPSATEVVVTEAAATETPEPEATDPPTNTPEPTNTPTIIPACGGPPVMTILVSGVDRENYSFGLSDAIRVARVDFQRQQVTVLAVPRGLWVEIPGIEDNTGVTHGLLNMAYFYGTEGMGYVDGAENGSSSLALTLQQNYGLRVDRYLAVNLRTFRNIIDTVGGIDVYLEGDVYRGHYGPFAEQELFLKAGRHHLDGREAEILARQRLDINPGTRLQYQTIILQALASKMLTPSGLKSLPSIVNQMRSSVRTDLSPSEVSMLLCLARKIDPKEDVTYIQIPRNILQDRRTYFAPLDAYIDNQIPIEDGKVRELMVAFQNGTWP